MRRKKRERKLVKVYRLKWGHRRLSIDCWMKINWICPKGIRSFTQAFSCFSLSLLHSIYTFELFWNASNSPFLTWFCLSGFENPQNRCFQTQSFHSFFSNDSTQNAFSWACECVVLSDFFSYVHTHFERSLDHNFMSESNDFGFVFFPEHFQFQRNLFFQVFHKHSNLKSACLFTAQYSFFLPFCPSNIIVLPAELFHLFVLPKKNQFIVKNPSRQRATSNASNLVLMEIRVINWFLFENK